MTNPAKQELDVEVEVKELAGGQVELRVRVPAEPVSRVKEEALRTFTRRANIPGFRKGKVPRALVERYVDQESLKDKIVDSLVGDAYDAAVEKAALNPLDTPLVSGVKLEGDGTLTFLATVTLRPKIELGEYKGLTGTRRIVPVAEAQVDAEVERMRLRRARFADLPSEAGIEQGDLVIVDYEMYVDGEKREDASASGYPLEVGRDELFPEMNEALLGAKVGETRDVEIKYPDTHSDKSLAGRSAQFKVTIGAARRRQLPELDDELAKQAWGAETVSEMRDQVRELLAGVSKAISEDELRASLVRQVAEAASLDVPEALVGREVDRRIEEIQEELDRRGLTLNQHLRNTGRTFDDWRADLETDSRAAARRALVLDEIGQRENIRVTEEEIHQEMRRLAEVEEVSEQEIQHRHQEPGPFNRLITRLYHRKITQFLLDNAQVTEEIVEPSATTEEEQGSGDAG